MWRGLPFNPYEENIKFLDPQTAEPFWESHLGPQTWALLHQADEILYGGARGGGKTAALIAWLTMGNLKLPTDHRCYLSYLNHPRYRALVLRRNAADLKEFVSEASEFFRHFGLKGNKAKDNPAEFHFESGAVIYTNHLKSEDAFEKYKGASLQKIAVEELTLIEDENSYLKIFGSLRSPYPEMVPQIFCTTNPDGNGAPWVRKRFINVRGANGALIPWGTTMIHPYARMTRVFIPAKLSDNPSLRPDYLQRLKLQDEKTRRAWIDGDWDAMSGAYFSSFRPNGPLPSADPPEPDWARHVIKAGSVHLPSWWPRAIGVDWGFKDNAAAIWTCQNQQDNRLHCYDELVTNQVGAEQLGVRIARKTERDLLDYPGQIPLYLSHDAFAVRDVTKTTSELMVKGIEAVLGHGAALLAQGAQSEEGKDEMREVMAFDPDDHDFGNAKIVVYRAGKERVGVWQYLRSLLRFDPMIDLGNPDQEYVQRLLKEWDGHIKVKDYLAAFEKRQEVLPGILFHSTCVQLIDEIANAVHDERKPEDILDARVGTSHMDALQALRHRLMFLQKQQNAMPYRQYFAERMAKAEQYADDPNILAQVARKAQADFLKTTANVTLRLKRSSSRRVN